MLTRYVRESIVNGNIEITDELFVDDGFLSIPAGEIWRPGHEPVGSILPYVSPPIIRHIVKPMAVYMSFLSVLGQQRGMEVWIEINKSTDDSIIFWRSVLLLMPAIDVDDPNILQAFSALFQTNDSNGVPILTENQGQQIMAALRNFAQ